MTKNADKYFKELQKSRDKAMKELTQTEEREIFRIYNRAFNDAYDDLLKSKQFDSTSATTRAKAEYVQQLYDELNRLQGKVNKKFSADTRINMRNFLNSTLPEMENDPQFKALQKEMNKATDITNKWIIEQITKGNIYKDGKALSDRIWDVANGAGSKINFAITSMIAQGKGAAEIAKVLKQFGTGGHRTWDKNKIKEKLGPGYARKYSSGLDYEALRLARTTLNHMSQLGTMNWDKINPYAGALKWVTDHTNGKTCDLCISRATDDHDGLGPGIYLMNHVPFDHPNGYCHTSIVLTIKDKNGNIKVVSPTEMAKDIGKWIKGEPNSGMMDKLYGDIPVDPRWKKPKGIKEPKEPTLSPVQQFVQFVKNGGVNTDREYTKLRREAIKHIDDTMKKTKARLSKQYAERTEIEMIRFNQMRELYNKKQKEAYGSYVQTGHSFDINRHLYEGKYKPGGRNKLDKEIDALKALISTQKLEKDSQFVRYSGLDYLNSLLKQVGSDFKYQRTDNGPKKQANIIQLTDALVGKKVKNDAFTSVSFDKKKNVFVNKPMMIEIYAKEGTEALHTMNYRESELVLQAGTEFIVRGVELVQEKNKWGDDMEYLKLILETS